jgi:hypothetical protein
VKLRYEMILHYFSLLELYISPFSFYGSTFWQCTPLFCCTSGLNVTNPELLEEWFFNKNEISPNQISSGSHKKIRWKCKRDHTHLWESTVRNRVNGALCPYRSGKKATRENCLASLRPNLAQEWHPTLNNGLTPTDYTASSSKKVWWQCVQNKEHVWEATINNNRVANNSGCPYYIVRK